MVASQGLQGLRDRCGDPLMAAIDPKAIRWLERSADIFVDAEELSSREKALLELFVSFAKSEPYED